MQWRSHTRLLVIAWLIAPALLFAEERRTRFDVRLTDGSRATGSAGAFEYQEGEYFIATGGVKLNYRDLELSADRARIDVASNLLTAEGEVVLDEGPQRLTGSTLEYDLETRTGTVSDAVGYVDPDYYFKGSKISKTGPESFRVDDGVFTSCEQDSPSWSIHLSRADITIDEYARIHNARLKLKKLPVLYTPYLLWPARVDRATGFLVPQPGYSDRRGFSMSLAYFKTFGRSADMTIYSDLSTEEYYGIGTEVRYRPSVNTEGTFDAYFLSEPADIDPEDFNNFFDPNRQPGDDRWRVSWQHETKNLWGKFRGVINFQEYSDFDYPQDYERKVSNQSRSFIYSNAYLSRNFGQNSLNIMIDRRQRILSDGEVDDRSQLPEVEYKLRPTKLGNTPIYLSLQSAVNYFNVDRGDFSIDYGRADFAPTISAPLSRLSWLSAKLNLGGRATYYTDSLNEDQSAYSGDSLTRVFPQASLEIVGPSVSRIFERKGGSKLKHIIEPRIDYLFVGDFDEQDQVSLFDEVDTFRPVNGARFALVNRFLSKPADESKGAFEIGSFSIAQNYSFDDDQHGQESSDGTMTTQEGPLLAVLRFNPSRTTSVKADVTYNTLFSELQAFSFTGTTGIGPHTVGLSWFTRKNAERGETTSDQLRFGTRLALSDQRLALQAELSYDLLKSELLQQRYFLNWQAQCYGWRLEFRESNIRDVDYLDYRFSFSLKNVGSFIDLNGRL